MFEPPVQRLIDELARLPGIGRKSAQRLAFHILNVDEVDAERLANSILDMRTQIRLCSRCFNVAAGAECTICLDTRRDTTIMCVVERAQDIVVVENTHEFSGRYHVLGGSISPIAGIGPDQLHFRELLARIDPEGVEEVIAATNPTVDGDATAYYVARVLKPLGVKVTRLASGLPVGVDLGGRRIIKKGRALVGRQEL